MPIASPAASGVAVSVELARLPVSAAVRARTGGGEAALLALATAGDDYELLFTAGDETAVLAAAALANTPVTRVGLIGAGSGLKAIGASGDDVTPGRLGWEH